MNLLVDSWDKILRQALLTNKLNTLYTRSLSSGSSDKRVRRPWDKTLYLYILLLYIHYVYECLLYSTYISIFRFSRKIDEREEAVYSYNSVH